MGGESNEDGLSVGNEKRSRMSTFPLCTLIESKKPPFLKSQVIYKFFLLEGML